MEPRLAKLVEAAVAKASSSTCHVDKKVECEAELLPHEGYVFVDLEPSGIFVASHCVTGERRALPPGQWCMQLQDGFGCCTRTDADADPICIEDLLTQTVYVSSEGSLLVVSNAMAGTVDLTAKMQRYSEANLELLVGTAKNQQFFHAAIPKLPRRPNCRLLISLKS